MNAEPTSSVAMALWWLLLAMKNPTELSKEFSKKDITKLKAALAHLEDVTGG